MIGAALAIARVKLVLELRRREVIFAMLLFIAATIVIVHFALSGDTGAGTRAAAGMLWAAVVFTAVLGKISIRPVKVLTADSANNPTGAGDFLNVFFELAVGRKIRRDVVCCANFTSRTRRCCAHTKAAYLVIVASSERVCGGGRCSCGCISADTAAYCIGVCPCAVGRHVGGARARTKRNVGC
jgi:hypothetical protein